jgi:hypothetical protein
MKNAIFCLWRRLQPPAHAGSSLADFSTLKMEAIRSSETSVHTISTRRHIPLNRLLLNIETRNSGRKKKEIGCSLSSKCTSLNHLC